MCVLGVNVPASVCMNVLCASEHLECVYVSTAVGRWSPEGCLVPTGTTGGPT